MKTNLLTTGLLLVTSVLFAQNTRDKVFYLDSLHDITTEQNYKYTRIVEDYDSKKNTYVISEYYKSGKISMSAVSKDKNNLKLEGIRIDYYENGNKKRESNYVGNQLIGKQLEWYDNTEKKMEKDITWDPKNKISIVKVLQFWDKNGKQTVIEGNGQYENTDENLYEKGEIKNGKRQGNWVGTNTKNTYSYSETYKNGKFRSGISIDKNNNKYPYKEIMKKPEAKYGINKFYQYLGRNFIIAKNESIDGKIQTSFIIDKDGKIVDVKIIKGLRKDLDNQVVNLLYKYDNWIPGEIRGMPVRVKFGLPVTIKNP